MKTNTIFASLMLLAVTSLQAQSSQSSSDTMKDEATEKKAPEPMEAVINNPLPAFSFKDMEGNTITSEGLKGKVVMLNIWFTKCAPCIMEMPELNKIKQDFIGQDVVFLSMALEDKQIVKKFLKKHQFDFAILPGTLLYAVNISSTLPMNMIIDREGIVRKFTWSLPYETSINEQGEKLVTFNSSDIRTAITSLLEE